MNYPKYDPTLPGKFITTSNYGNGIYKITPWGYLEEIRIIFTNPIPNMDASSPHIIEFNFNRSGLDGMFAPTDDDITLVQLVRNVA